MTTQARTCRQCGRGIINEGGRWIDPEATGDDSVWHETCDSSDTFTAEHVPMPDDPAVVELHYPDGTCARWNVTNATGDRVANMLGTPDTLKC